MDTSVANAIQRHVVNSTLQQQTKDIAIPNINNIPPELQNLPPGCSIQEVSASTAFSSSALNNNDSNNMSQLMKYFMQKMDE